MLVHLGLTPWTLGSLAVPLALVLCLVLANTFHCLFGKPIMRFFKTITAIAVLPAYAIAIIALMMKYERMDAADASLVVLSEIHRDAKIITTDRRDFSVFRRSAAIDCLSYSRSDERDMRTAP